MDRKVVSLAKEVQQPNAGKRKLRSERVRAEDERREACIELQAVIPGRDK